MATPAAALPGIEPGQLVRIAIPGRERATASVTHVTRTWIAVRLSGPYAPPARDLHGRRAAVEYVGDDGLHRLHGDLEQVHTSNPSSLRFVLSSGPQFLGRRRHLRTALTAPVVLTSERTGEKLRGRSVNLSEGGMLADSFGPGIPGAGERVRFTLVPRSSSESIVGTAVVIRADRDAGELALSFEHLPKLSADELARTVYENEQGMRALRR